MNTCTYVERPEVAAASAFIRVDRCCPLAQEYALIGRLHRTQHGQDGRKIEALQLALR